ncbi:hypothetical protein HMPREF1287_02080 [Corynebacterium sp. KPL1986]|nr:hypothetical protein HMPREF1287_02080 [Corynebacterium sp. KPL1986]
MTGKMKGPVLFSATCDDDEIGFKEPVTRSMNEDRGCRIFYTNDRIEYVLKTAIAAAALRG